MKRALLLMVISAALVTLGFAQTTDAGSNTGISNPPVANPAPPPVAVSPAPETVLPPVVETVAPPVLASPSSQTVNPPPAMNAAPPPAAVSPAPEPVSPPAVEAIPPATATPAPETVVPPAVETVAPAATVSPSPETVGTPAPKAAHATRRSTHPRKLSAAQDTPATAPAATVSPSSEIVTPLPGDAKTPAVIANPPAETASTPAPVAAAPVVTHKGGSLWLLISVAVLVLVLGTLIPAFGRWRKRRTLEETEAPNLSFTNEAAPDLEKPEPRRAA